MPVTLKDIAERVGKSVPTVSRALADFDDISPQMRREVQRVAEEMGYEPNITACNLQKRAPTASPLFSHRPAPCVFPTRFLASSFPGWWSTWVNAAIT